MRRNGTVYLLAVLKRNPGGSGTIVGMALVLAALWLLPTHRWWLLALWDPSSTALVVAHTAERMNAQEFDGFILGSSQINQVQPSILRSITGLDFHNSAIPGGDIAYMLSMSRAIAARSRNKPVVLAEFSRYVASDMEELVYRDTLRFVPARYWIMNEMPLAYTSKKYRQHYCDGILNSILPVIRYKEAIKAYLVANAPRLAFSLMHPSSQPGIVRRNTIAQDGHGGPYPHCPPPYAGAEGQQTAGNSHKLKSWHALLQLHHSGVIRLVLVIPPFHRTWAPFYETFYRAPDSFTANLLRFLKQQGVAVIDCSSFRLEDDVCMDAHHFTWSGAARFSEYVGNGLSRLLALPARPEATAPVPGERLSDVYRASRTRE